MATIAFNSNVGAGGLRSSSGTSSSSTSTTTSTPQFAAGGEEALRQLLAQLAGPGTQEQQEQRAARRQEITDVRGIRQDYSKDAAFADAQGAVNQQQRLAMEELIPTLMKAAEGAGASSSSMRALLAQDAANRAAESASALGLKASVDYGQISAGLSNTLEALTRADNTNVDALLKALALTKSEGTNTTTTTTSSGSGSGGGSSGPAWDTKNPYLYSFSIPARYQGTVRDANAYSAQMLNWIARGGTPEDFQFNRRLAL